MYKAAEPKPVIRQLARQLGVHPEALRNWIRQDQADAGERKDLLSTPEREKLVALRREVAELRRERDLEGGECFFRPGTRPDPATVLKLVDEQKDTFGLEPILRTVGEKTSTYYDRCRRREQPSARQLRDGELLTRIREIHAESGGIYGSPRVHAVLRREGQAVGRKRVERLMREAGIVGVCPARKVRTTIPNPADPRPEDLVKRNFTADAPDRLWVTDLTLIETGEGPLWLSSIRDAFSRRIVAWHTSPRPDAELVCTALEYALASRDYERGQLIHHADSEYVEYRMFPGLLTRTRIDRSVGWFQDVWCRDALAVS
jgi:transposase-like protein